MSEIKVFSIGKIVNEETVQVIVDPQYAAGLTGLEGYSHVQILWWMDRCDNATDRCILRPMSVDAAVNFRRRITFPVKIRYTIKGRHKPVAMQR